MDNLVLDYLTLVRLVHQYEAEASKCIHDKQLMQWFQTREKLNHIKILLITLYGDQKYDYNIRSGRND